MPGAQLCVGRRSRSARIGTYAPFTAVMAPPARQAGVGVGVVGVQHESPLPAREGVWEGSAAVSEPPIFDALDRDHSGARGGRTGGRGALVPGLLRAIVALGVRALARCAAGARASATHAAPGALRRVRVDACALALVDGPAPARWGRGDRRGAVPGGRGRRASPDRARARTAGGHGSWLAAGGAAARGEPAGVRDSTDRVAGRGARRGHPGRQQSGRRGRGDHACCSCVGVAVRPRRHRPVGTRCVAHWRAASRSPAPPAVVGRFLVDVCQHELIAIQAAHDGGGSSAATTSMSSRARSRRLTRRDGAATPVDLAERVQRPAPRDLLLLSYPTLRSSSKAARACRS